MKISEFDSKLLFDELMNRNLAGCCGYISQGHIVSIWKEEPTSMMANVFTARFMEMDMFRRNNPKYKADIMESSNQKIDTTKEIEVVDIEFATNEEIINSLLSRSDFFILGMMVKHKTLKDKIFPVMFWKGPYVILMGMLGQLKLAILEQFFHKEKAILALSDMQSFGGIVDADLGVSIWHSEDKEIRVAVEGQIDYQVGLAEYLASLLTFKVHSSTDKQNDSQ